MKKKDQVRGRPHALMRRSVMAALACALMLPALPAAALAPLAEEDGLSSAAVGAAAADDPSPSLTTDAEDALTDGSEKEEEADGDDRTDGLQEPSPVANEDAAEAEEGVLESDRDQDGAASEPQEDAPADEWLRPAPDEAIPLVASNAAFTPAGGRAVAYPLMQSCTSRLLGLPTVIAYGTPLEGGHDLAAEEGVALSALVPSNVDTSDADRYVYWKANLLDAAQGECQTLETNANCTGDGTVVQRLRYNARAGSWEALAHADDAAWFPIDVGPHAHQLVFYYKKIAHLDENVSLSNDNDYLTPEQWCDPTSWARNNKDAVCFLYQLYDESGAVIGNIPPAEAYYYSHANVQDIVVSLSETLTGKYEVAKVSWDSYQEYIRYGQTYHQTCPDFQIPGRFEDLSNAEDEKSFTIDLTETACTRYSKASEHVEDPAHGGSVQTAAQSCTQYHQGLFVVGIMVRALPSTHGITVRYWGGQPEDAVELGAFNVRVAGSDPYDWDASGYEEGSAIDVVTDLPYHGQNVIQEVSLGLPVAYAGCYAETPSVRILDGNVLDLYFAPLPLTALVSSEPVCKVYDGTPLAPAAAHVVLPDGFECVLEEGAVTGERTHAGVTVPELDQSRIHIRKLGQPADVKNAFAFECALGEVEVIARRISLTAEDAAKVYREADPAFAAPEATLLSPDDGHPAIIEGDDLSPRTVREGDEEHVLISEHGNVVAYREVLEPVWNENPDYAVTAQPAHFTIRPARAVIYVQDACKMAGQPDEDEDAGRVFGGLVEGLLDDDELGSITYERVNAGVEEPGIYEDVLTARVADANRDYTYVVVNGTFTILEGAVPDPDQPNGAEVPDAPSAPGVPDAPDGPDGPDPAEPQAPDAPEDPDVPDAPEAPRSPDDPNAPESPAAPGQPDGNAVLLLDVDGIPAGDDNGHDGEGWQKTYDGREMRANAVAEKPGSTLLYAVDAPEGWSEVNPSFTDVGSHRVYIMATNPAYADTDPISVSMTIAPRRVTIRAFDATKEYGEADPAFSGEVKNLVQEDDLGLITYHRTNDAEEVGTYPQVIDAAYQRNPNYEVAVSLGTMDIAPNSVIVEGVTGAGSFIEDALTPLSSRFDPPDHSCWIHWWMLLGILATLICAAGSLVHRRKHIRALDGMEDEVRERFEDAPRP